MAKTKKHVRKRANRKAKKSSKPSVPGLAQFQLRQAGNWPLYECRVNADWQDTMQISQLCVARRSPRGEIAAGIFLVDLACLGVKNAYASIFHSETAYRRELLSCPEGKPFFVNGPYDDVDHILRTLERNVGQGNYDFLMQIGGSLLDEFEDEIDDDWEEE